MSKIKTRVKDPNHHLWISSGLAPSQLEADLSRSTVGLKMPLLREARICGQLGGLSKQQHVGLRPANPLLTHQRLGSRESVSFNRPGSPDSRDKALLQELHSLSLEGLGIWSPRERESELIIKEGQPSSACPHRPPSLRKASSDQGFSQKARLLYIGHLNR